MLRWLALLGAVAVPGLALRGPAPGRRLLARQLLLLGPCWYFITTALFYGTYYDDRHHSLPLVGLVFAWTVAADRVLSLMSGRGRAFVLGAALVSAVVSLLPATLRASRSLHEASRVTERARAEIETDSKDLKGKTLFFDVDTIFHNPKHPYTTALLRSIPRLGLKTRERQRLESIRGTVPDPYSIPKGCPFHPRCSQRIRGVCDTQEPPNIEVEPGHKVRCVLYA